MFKVISRCSLPSLSPKYILGDACNIHGLRRVIAIRDFSDVKSGDIGGWVSSAHNLSHAGNCWVYDEAMIHNLAAVREDAVVMHDANMYHESVVFGHATICNEVIVWGRARISGFAILQNRDLVGCRDIVTGIDGDHSMCTTMLRH